MECLCRQAMRALDSNLTTRFDHFARCHEAARFVSASQPQLKARVASRHWYFETLYTKLQSLEVRRAFFRQNLFGVPHDSRQDVKEGWFAGVHSDVGGSHPESESQLSQVALRWMLCEAELAGLLVDPHRKFHILGGKPPYVVGTLVVDLFDSRTKQLIWRGWATDALPDNPKKETKKLDKEIELFKDFPPK
jgi:Uncharacterized alpha/beta hydrolase domain (DUF2235)/Domain of unknown function (DUF4136)